MGAGGGSLVGVDGVDFREQLEAVLGDDQKVPPVLPREGADGLDEPAHLLAVIGQRGGRRWGGVLFLRLLSAALARLLGTGGGRSEEDERQNGCYPWTRHARHP